MAGTYRELGFDALLAIASGVALAAYMLGVVLDPIPAAAVGFLLVGAGAMTLVSRRARATAAVIGLVAVGLAGVVVPRVVTSVVRLPGSDELAITLAGSGLVLLVTFALLRVTAFGGQDGQPA